MIKNITRYTCDFCGKTVEHYTVPDRWLKIKLSLTGFTGGIENDYLVCDGCCPMPIKSTIFKKLFNGFTVLQKAFSTQVNKRK